MINVFNSLQGQTLPEKFKWMNEPQKWKFEDQVLYVQAESETDFFNDPATTDIVDSAHFLYTTLEGDFTLKAYVKTEMLADYDAAAMMVMLDNKHWAKLCYEFTYKKPMIVSVVTRAVSDDSNSLEVPPTGIYLRITRFDDCIAFHYSYDDKWWTMIRYFKFAPGPIKAGVVAQSPTGNGCSVQISNLTISSGPIREIRSGK